MIPFSFFNNSRLRIAYVHIMAYVDCRYGEKKFEKISSTSASLQRFSSDSSLPRETLWRSSFQPYQGAPVCRALQQITPSLAAQHFFFRKRDTIRDSHLCAHVRVYAPEVFAASSNQITKSERLQCRWLLASFLSLPLSSPGSHTRALSYLRPSGPLRKLFIFLYVLSP